MANVQSNWQAWILTLLTGATTVAWYLAYREYQGPVGSVIFLGAAGCCGIAAALYLGRALGNVTINKNPWLSGVATFGTVLTVLFGGWEFLLNFSGTGNAADYAAGWLVAAALTLWLGYSEIRKAAMIVKQVAESGSDAPTTSKVDPTFWRQ